jgi:hypothetical protein
MTPSDVAPHILAHVNLSKVTDWKRLMNPPTGKAIPFVYGSNDGNVFAEMVREGSVLWVISATPDRRPPSLVAKLDVIGRLDDAAGETFGIPASVRHAFMKRFKYIAVGDPEASRFYGYNNASRALLSLVLKWVRRERTLSEQLPYPQGTCIWRPSYATPLNRPAGIVGDATPLIDLHRAAVRCVFISWKRKDNWSRRASIRRLAYALADEGLFVWLDVLAFPPSIALKMKVDPDARLIRRLLRYGYEQCKGLLALETAAYGSKGLKANWTLKEWNGKFEKNRPARPLPFRAVYRFDSSKASARLVQKRDRFMSGMEWAGVAKIIRDEMASRFPLCVDPKPGALL